MKSKSIFSVYIMIGMIAVITTQALPVVYTSYGLDSNQVYNLISIVFLATAFQPILGFVIDKFFTQERGISLMFTVVGIISLGLVFIDSYHVLFITILIFSVFRVPLFAITDGYTAGQVQKFGLNMGIIRAGSTIGYGVGMTLLMLFLNSLGLSSNYTFLYIAIAAFIAVAIIEFSPKYEVPVTCNSNISVSDSDSEHTTKWGIVALLLIMQVTFFGFSVLKVSYTTPFLVEHGYSNSFIAATTIAAMMPLFILMPLFGKLFTKFKYTTIILFGVFANMIQTGLFLLFPNSVLVIMVGSFFTGFIFPLYTPIFGMFLRKTLNPKYISTGFTTIFTIQNLLVFFFNQFVIINVLDRSGTVNSAYLICFTFYTIALIPIMILKFKKY